MLAAHEQGRPEVSVIVPVWNGHATLGACLSALTAQTLAPERYEIIVVDNGSSDDSVAIARAVPGVVVLEEASPGSYAARNTGVAHARGQWLAFTDADCIPAPDWLERALAAAEATPRFGVLAGRIDLFEEGAKAEGDSVYAEYERLFSFPQAHAARGNCATANWLSPRQALLAVGGFNAGLKSGGDREMALRLRDAGWPLVYVPDMIVRHPVRASRAELVRKRRRLSGGRWDRTDARTATARLGAVARVTAWDTGRRIWRAMSAPGLSVGRRVAVIGLTVDLAFVATAEFLRLYRGRAASRD